MLELQDLFEHLPAPQQHGDAAVFAVTPIDQMPSYLLGRDPSGSPLVLVPRTALGETDLLHVELEHLSVTHDLICRLEFDDGREDSGRYSIIRCGRDPSIHPLFLRLMAGLMLTMGPDPSRESLARSVGRLVELFRALTQAPRKSVQGLWAELFVIAESSDPGTLIDAWHAIPNDIYDFNAGAHRLEVKSWSGRERVHSFSLAQLRPPSSCEVIVASVSVEPAGGGTDMMALVAEIRDRVASRPERVLHVDSIVTSTLGTSWRQTTARFDRHRARDSYSFFPGDAVPQISLEHVPPQVGAVRFTANLSGIPGIPNKQLAATGDLFRAAAPSTGSKGA